MFERHLVYQEIIIAATTNSQVLKLRRLYKQQTTRTNIR